MTNEELRVLYIIGYLGILFAMYVFNIIGSAVLGPESFKEASSDGLSYIKSISIPLLVMMSLAYMYNITL
ncbi:hypothetical protein [Paenibacillus alvei]|uniref:hypothetical protein n=1 Tax=Paenibacillus alvei TaxID=44250 RepID=UPI0013DC0D4A|nr:hypothetical protein [Paenibacillus alvei]NEZ44371.1 hypothetical protein [Paenibacillus alvei]